MLEKDFDKLLKTVSLKDAYSHNKCKKYYLFDNSQHTFILILDNEIRVGGVLICAGDIQCTIFKEFQDKHYLSNLFKSTFWKKHFHYINIMSISEDCIIGINDFNKKLHLSKILNAKVKNLWSAIEYTIENYGDEQDKYYYKNCPAINVIDYDFNKCNNYKEIINIYKSFI